MTPPGAIMGAASTAIWYAGIPAVCHLESMSAATERPR